MKWLRRIEVGEAPYNTRDEALKYIDLMPDGTHCQYTSLQEVKSVILSPSGVRPWADRAFMPSPVSPGPGEARFAASMCPWTVAAAGAVRN